MKNSTLAALAIAGLLMGGGCASVQRMASYTGGADAQIGVQGRRLNLWMHPSDPTIMAAMTVGDAAGGGFIRGATFGLVGGFKLDPRAIDAGLAQWLAPTGCSAEPVRELGSDSTNFEARYSCPAGVDLRSVVEGQRASLMQGAAIRMP